MDALSRTILKMEEKQQEETQQPPDRVAALFSYYDKLLNDANETLQIRQSTVEALERETDRRQTGYNIILRLTAKHVGR